MKNRRLFLVVLVGAVLLGAAGCFSGRSSGSMPSQADQDSIATLLLARHLEKPQSNGVKTPCTYFVSVDGKDPDPDVANDLKGSNLVPGSLLPGLAVEGPQGAGGIRLKSNNQPAARLSVTIHPTNDDGSVPADCSIDFETGIGNTNDTFLLVKQRGIWGFKLKPDGSL